MSVDASFIVYSDLDGTLLDHDSYSFSAAVPALSALNTLKIPLILVTSKTRVEIEGLRLKLAEVCPMIMQSPFVSENGAAIYFHDHLAPEEAERIEGSEFKALGFAPKRSELQSFITNELGDWGDAFMSFSQLGDEGVAEVTGLSLDAARLANQRDFSEPLLWKGDEVEKADLIACVEKHGMQVLKGGRFLHITKGFDKGQALDWLQSYYHSSMEGFRLAKSIALGDGGNDVAMLNAADYPVAIRSNAHAYPPVAERETLIRTKGIGPVGWNDAILSLLSEYVDKH